MNFIHMQRYIQKFGGMDLLKMLCQISKKVGMKVHLFLVFAVKVIEVC